MNRKQFIDHWLNDDSNAKNIIMTEKTQQEKAAMGRQIALFEKAFEKAKSNGGIWLETDGKSAPGLYQKPLQISPFNAVILGMHSDQNDYRTNQYTLFSEAKKRGEAVQSNEKGVPFFWYNWSEYVNKYNPDDKISRNEYLTLNEKEKEDYKGLRSREVRTLFNIEQTTLPMVDKNAFEEILKENGRVSDRETVEEVSDFMRIGTHDLIFKCNDNLVNIRMDDGKGIAYYDNKKDLIFLPNRDSYENFEDYTRETIKQIVSATGHPQRLAREGMMMSDENTSSEDLKKQELLIVEVASAVKLQELGVSAKLSPESLQLTDYWLREMKENPCLLDIIERDVNNAVAMIKKAEMDEKIKLNSSVLQQTSNTVRGLLPKHYYVAEEIKSIPNRDTKEFVVVRNSAAKQADVILPAGASISGNNEIQGMNKKRIEHALKKEGYDNVTFYNNDGSLGYHPDDSYFDGKEVSISRMNKWDIEDLTKIDVSDAVRRSGAVDFDKVLFLRDDENKWTLYIKPENEKEICVYPDKSDINTFFVTLKQGDEGNTEQMRQDMALKYYVLASRKPEIKVDLFKSKATPEELAKIERVNIFKTKETKDKPSVILCLPTIEGEKKQAREVSPQQWQRLWLADDMKDYKNHLAATLFADVIRNEENQQESIDIKKADQKEDTEMQESEVNNPKVSEKENKATEAKQLTPIMKQFIDLKKKHPDAMLLFLCGDFYETYKEDAVNASRILGITLTKSSKQQDDEGKQLQMAGFPYHALDSYLPKLIRAGQRVAICDQLEMPKRAIKSEGFNEQGNQAKAENNEIKSQIKEEHSSALHR